MGWSNSNSWGSDAQEGWYKKPAAGAGGSLTFTAIANPTAIGGGGITSPASFSAVAIGTASSDRIVVVSVVNKMATSTLPNSTVTGVTIGGVSAAQATIQRTSQHENSIWWLLVTSGTTATIAVTISSGSGWSDGVCIQVGTITGSATASVSSTVTATPPFYAFTNSNAGTVTVATGGVAVISGVNDSSPGTTSWTNTTSSSSDFDQSFTASGGIAASLAHATASAIVTQAVTTSGGSGWISASFQP
jgi:hypothetical protein